MTRQKAGNRHILLMYRRSWNRLWKPILLLGILLGFIWWQAGTAQTVFVQNANNLWVLAGSVICLLVGLFALVARNMSYVQPLARHFRIVTPFMKLNVAYQRVRTIRPVDMVQIFPPDKQSWAKQRFLAPLYRYTGLAIELKGYPLSRIALRLFFPPQFFLPQATGFVLVVSEWMKLSTELDTRIGAMQGGKQGSDQPGLIESIRRQNRGW